MTTTSTDRAAIEAIARELTDEQWADRFAELDRAAWNPGTRVRESTRALLACLDEVVAEANRRLGEPGHQEWLRSLPEPMRKAAIRRSKEASR